MILEKINSPADLKKLNLYELEKLSSEIREFLINNISKTGGHLASNLGVVELTIALHYVFDTPKDKIIWDVGHQCYVHKILTGRKDKFHTLRQFNGLSGFPKPSESEYDTYIVGHASTALSLATGEAVSKDLSNKNYHIIAVIGDGSLTGGLAFEALNNLGHLKKNVLIILNSNEMSISPTTGAIAKYINRIITANFYYKAKDIIDKFILSIPKIGKFLYNIKNKLTEIIKGFLVPGIIFEELGFMYIGPDDGHNLKNLIKRLEDIKKLKPNRPILYHIVTVKGKGYKPAENLPEKFHGIPPFDIITGNNIESNGMSYTELFGKTILQLARKDKKIVAITAAMASGTGLYYFREEFPERFFDVGIAEEHAVVFAASLALNGFKPVVAIYSTFLQRAFDQIIHDVAIAKAPVKFFVDRAGISGEDGETHQGSFDLSYLRLIPNLVITAPKNGEEFRNLIYTALNYNKGPFVVRYPKDVIPEKYIDINKPFKLINLSEIEILNYGKEKAIIATGSMVSEALKLKDKIGENKTLVLNLRVIKPLNEKKLIQYLKPVKEVIVLEENVINGGVGEQISRILNSHNICKKIKIFSIPDKFIEHGSRKILREKYILTAEKILKNI